MEAFNLVNRLEDFATAKGWLFFNGDNFFVNRDADKAVAIGQHALWVDLNAVPSRAKGNKINKINYSGAIALGRKFDEDGTPASLDEAFHQKWNRRLYELINTLALEIGGFSCSNNLQIISESYIYDINKFDTNYDFVVGTFNIEQENFNIIPVSESNTTTIKFNRDLTSGYSFTATNIDTLSSLVRVGSGNSEFVFESVSNYRLQFNFASGDSISSLLVAEGFFDDIQFIPGSAGLIITKNKPIDTSQLNITI